MYQFGIAPLLFSILVCVCVCTCEYQQQWYLGVGNVSELVKCWVLVHVRFRSAAPVASSGHLCICVSPSKHLSCSPVISRHRLSSLTNR